MANIISTIQVHDVSFNENTEEETKKINSLVTERASNNSMSSSSSMNINGALCHKDIQENIEEGIDYFPTGVGIETFEDSISVISICNTSDDAEGESQRKKNIKKKGRETDELDTDPGTQNLNYDEETMEYNPDSESSLKIVGKCLIYTSAVIATCVLFVILCFEITFDANMCKIFWDINLCRTSFKEKLNNNSIV